MRTKLFISLFVAMLFTFTSYGQEGAAIFKKNCAVCHSIGKGKFVGPDLKGSDKKYDIGWLTQWIKSSQTMVKNKDPKAVQIFNDNNHLVMPDQALSDAEINTLVAYIAEQSVKLDQPPPVPAAPQASSAVITNSSRSTSNASTGITSQNIIYILITFIIFLTVIIIVMSKVIKDITESNKNNLNG